MGLRVEPPMRRRSWPGLRGTEEGKVFLSARRSATGEEGRERREGGRRRRGGIGRGLALRTKGAKEDEFFLSVKKQQIWGLLRSRRILK